MHIFSELDGDRLQAAGFSGVRRIFTVLAASLVLAVAAHLAFPLAFTPVPFSLQPLAVLGVGLALGPVDGALAVLAYLAEGAAGLPVFSPTGPGGLLQLMGPTAGYLWADPLVAALAGFAAPRLARRIGPFAGALAACAAATTLLFAAGAGWLQVLTHAGARAVWLEAVAPFLPGEAIKIVLAASLFRFLSFRSAAAR